MATTISSVLYQFGTNPTNSFNLVAPPIGMVSYFASTPSYPWVIANGASITQVSAPELFVAVGHMYANDVADVQTLESLGQFRLPNLLNKYIRGTDIAIGVNGGSDAVTLTANNLPDHQHPLSIYSGTVSATPPIITVETTTQRTLDAATATLHTTVLGTGTPTPIDINPPHIGLIPAILVG